MGINPVPEVRHFGIHPGVVGASAAIAPGRDAMELSPADEGASGVTLAGVLTSFWESCAQHGVGDLRDAVGLPAGVVIHNRDVHLRNESLESRDICCFYLFVSID